VAFGGPFGGLAEFESETGKGGSKAETLGSVYGIIA
jgi:hypothetical protein